MSIEELVRGPNRSAGPDQPWVIVAAKVQGVTPGFTIRDGNGDIYFIKMDPPRLPQLATSTEVIATKFFHAFGYHVPENFLSAVDRTDLTIAPDTLLVDEDGKERKMEDSDIDKIFQKAHRLSSGGTPVIASRRLTGTPVGPFKYFATAATMPTISSTTKIGGN